MTTSPVPEAWVALPSQDDVRAAIGGVKHPYEILMGGVIPRMFRLALAHDVIGMPLVGLFNYVSRLADGFGLQPTEANY